MGLVDGDRLDPLARRATSSGTKAYEIAHRGIGYVPENRDIFPKLTVHQNLLLGEKQRGRRRRAGRFDDMYAHVPAPARSASTPRPACCRAASSRC